ncbi:unnamed protein product [Ectocarpus sp. 4 AP-2014]
MVRTGFGVRGIAPGVSGALLYLAALSTLSCGHAFVVSPSASRACSAAAQGSWCGSSSSSSRPRVGAGGVRARKLKGLEVAAGESAVESSSMADGDAVRVGQIEAFADKVSLRSPSYLFVCVSSTCVDSCMSPPLLFSVLGWLPLRQLLLYGLSLLNSGGCV